MKQLTETWLEATTFFNSVIGLHDSTIDEVSIVPGQSKCTLVLSDVYCHSEELGFYLAHKYLLVEMLGISSLTPKQADGLIGYDILDAELFAGSLWINTLAGNISFQFVSIRFLSPDAK